MGRDIGEVTYESHRYPSPLQFTASSHDALTTLQASQTLPNRDIVGCGGGTHHVQWSINTISNASVLSERWYMGESIVEISKLQTMAWTF